MANHIIKNGHLRDLEGRKDARKTFNDILPLAECLTKNSVFKAPIYDISSGGVFIRTSRHFSIGQEIAMTITFPVPIATLRVTGVIVRTSSKGVGVKFKIFFQEKSFH